MRSLLSSCRGRHSGAFRNVGTMKSSLALFSFCLPAILAFNLLAAEPTLRIGSLPGDLSVLNSPVTIRTEPDGRLFIAAPGETNLFNHPNGKSAVQNAPMALFEPADDFVLKARVSGQLKNVYDVAALVIYQDGTTWAKLCYENSVAKEPTVVSVVTRDVSDDCNSQTIAADHAYLAIVRKGPVFTFHYSPDGKTWRMVRHFNLNTTGKLKAGFAVHAWRAESFAATFSEITYTEKTPDNITNLNPVAK